MISASTEPSSSSRCASSTNTTDSSATRLFCGGRSPRTCAAEPTQSARKDQRAERNLITKQSKLSGAYDRPAELVEEARHGDRIGEPEGAGGLALPFAEALLRDVLVVGRLQRGRHGGGGSAGRGQGFGGIRVSWEVPRTEEQQERGGGGELAMRDGEGGETATEAGVSVCVREAENAMPCFGSVWVGLLVMNTENSGEKILFIYKIYHPGIFFL